MNYQLWLTLPEHAKLETSWKKFAIEKGHMKNISTKRPFVRNLFLVMKKGCHQFQGSKSLHPPPPFQNGEPAIIEKYPQAWWLNEQIGSKRCIFLHPTCKGVEEIREILLVGGPISIPVSMIWTYSIYLHFHQIIKDSNRFSSENRHL